MTGDTPGPRYGPFDCGCGRAQDEGCTPSPRLGGFAQRLRGRQVWRCDRDARSIHCASLRSGDGRGRDLKVRRYGISMRRTSGPFLSDSSCVFPVMASGIIEAANDLIKGICT